MNRLLHRTILLFGITTLSSFALGQDLPEPITPEALEKQAERIFEAKSAISKESSSWAEQRVLFQDLIELREREIAEIDDFTESARSRVEEVTAKRAELNAEEKARKEWRAEFEKKVIALEKEMRAALPFLPPPVREKAASAISRLEESVDAESALQERFRDVLTILLAARDFDSKLTIDGEIREFDGKRYQIDVLYLGLDHAWFVDKSGKVAGTGHPTPSGWVWTENSKLASKIRNAISVNKREVPPMMVSLPFTEKAGSEATPKETAP